MKRFLAVLMLVVMMCGCVGLAEEQKFDYTVLEKLDGYSYDKFEKTWLFSRMITKKSAGNFITVGLVVTGDKETVTSILLGAETGKNVGSSSDIIEKLMILADDTLITVSMIPVSDMQGKMLTTLNAEALQIIAEAKEVAFKAYLTDGSTRVFEPTAEETADFIQAAQIINDYDLLEYSTNWNFSAEEVQSLEEAYPLTIER